MCLYTDNHRPKVAKKPIKVWKRLIETDNGFETPFRHVEIKVGESLKGLNPNAEAQENIFAPDFFSEYIVDIQAVHAYKTKYDAEFWKEYGEIITEWEIPAGAKYWVGSEYSKGEIAATEMKFINVCED